MHKLKSFDQFSTEVKITQTRQVEEDNSTKRSDEAETFKNLLAEFNVTSIKELTEDQKPEFFNKLRGTEISESVALIEEGTRGQFGKIDKKGNIVSIYTHYDSYPENVLPLIKKGYKAGKNVDAVIKGGNSSGLEATPDKMNFYKDGSKNLKGSIADVKKYIKDASNDGAEYVYLWDEANKEWLMADVYAGTELQPAFESLSVSVNEAIKVEYKRDAKKVLTVYRNLFAKRLTDFGAMSLQGELGCIKYLFEQAMEDANFSREGFVISKNIKGNIGSFEIKMPGLGNYFIKIGATTTKRILDQYYSDIANAAGWSGIGIVEGTALYLESIKQEATGQSLLNAFNMSESAQIEESVITEGKSEVNAFLTMISKDYQFDKKHDDYTGFLNTDPSDMDDVAIEFINNVDKYKSLMKKHGLSLEPGYSDKEAIFVKESVITEASLSGIEFGNDDGIHPTKHIPLTKSLKKNKVKMEVEKEEGDHGYPEVKLTGKRKDIEKVLADIWGPDSIDDHEDAYESVITEAEIKSDEEFNEYANTVLKQAFGEEFDEAKAKKVIDGILAKADGDYGTAAGMLTSSLGA